MTARRKVKRKTRNRVTFVVAADMRAVLEQMSKRLHDEILKAVARALAAPKSRTKANRRGR